MPITDHQMQLCALDVPGLIAIAAYRHGEVAIPALDAAFHVHTGARLMARHLEQVLMEYEGAVLTRVMDLGAKSDVVEVPGERWTDRVELRLKRHIRVGLLKALPDLLKDPLAVLQRQELDRLYDDPDPTNDGLRAHIHRAAGGQA